MVASVVFRIEILLQLAPLLSLDTVLSLLDGVGLALLLAH